MLYKRAVFILLLPNRKHFIPKQYLQRALALTSHAIFFLSAPFPVHFPLWNHKWRQRCLAYWIVWILRRPQRKEFHSLLPMPFRHSLKYVFFPTGKHLGRYHGFLSCDYFLLVLLALLFSLPHNNVGTGRAFWNMELKVETTKVKTHSQYNASLISIAEKQTAEV